MLYEQPVFIWDLLESFVLNCLHVRISQIGPDLFTYFLYQERRRLKNQGSLVSHWFEY